ncbi:protein of unknown function DUF552 [Gloeothece citriformis PCC 7424]|uniref:Cell division protein SepF n=1 Tax=Gloeothece citriformis (strain PCC 7424) TaxID=65393 RepID=B7KDM0_GLOC7|nr:cell division protein SepF [Gloeothece citriformis]ACK70322.1 protein of unknown function DUF552 [Gloeothece citriformis PCC 7424]
MLLESISQNNSNLVVFQPQSLDEVTAVLETLRNRQAIVVNLNKLFSSQVQTFIDWVAGGTYAIDGQTIWVGELTFMFVPSNVKVTSQNNKRCLVSFNHNVSKLREFEKVTQGLGRTNSRDKQKS